MICAECNKPIKRAYVLYLSIDKPVCLNCAPVWALDKAVRLEASVSTAEVHDGVSAQLLEAGVDPSDICELCGAVHLKDGCVTID